jgi:alkylated DNA repair dioxygenase AlkB
MSLFEEPTLSLPIDYYPDFLDIQEANELYQHCKHLQWHQNHIKMVGKILPVPRLECIYGNEGCDYFYSKSVLLKPLPWTERLAELRDRITTFTKYKFNIVIGNQYCHGQHSIGWHSDNESSMGLNPAIAQALTCQFASVSLGAIRKFQIKLIGGKPSDFWLEHGSLLIMHPGCQSTHLHQVPKTKKLVGCRINLTFRPHIGGKK